MGRFPVRALCGDRRLKPVWNDSAVEIIDPAMLNCEAKLGIMNAGSRAGRLGLDHDQAAIDLLPPVHSGRILLSHKAALGKADPVQLHRIAFEPKQVAKLGLPFAHAQTQAMLEPAACGVARWCEPSAA